MRAARVRTESMAIRLAKKPISEGFELWDRGFILGAMRLFIFKAESSPPFQLGPCLDAVACLLMEIEEFNDAAENFTYAAEKYALIQQIPMSQLMRAKVSEIKQGAKAALSELDKFIEELSGTVNSGQSQPGGSVNISTIAALARAYYMRAEMKLKLFNEQKQSEGRRDQELIQSALDDVLQSISICNSNNINPNGVAAAAGGTGSTPSPAAASCWDRKHIVYYLCGRIHEAMGNAAAAVEAYESAASANPGKYLSPLVALSKLYRQGGVCDEGEGKGQGDVPNPLSTIPKDNAKALDCISRAIEVHPQSVLIRDKAFLMSEMGDDAGAIKYLNKCIAEPQVEEASSGVVFKGSTEATLLKAKAAILADMGNLQGALSAAEEALEKMPGDEEATNIITDIKSALTDSQ